MADSMLADARRKLRAAEFEMALLRAWPMGRTLTSIAEEHGWTRTEALKAVETFRWEVNKRHVQGDPSGSVLIYEPNSREFFLEPGAPANGIGSRP